MANWGDMTIPSSGGEKKQLFDQIDKLELKNKVWKGIRFVGPVFAYAEAWIKLRTKTGKIVTFPKYSSDLDPVTGKWKEETKCPYRAGGIQFRVQFLSNVIDRDAQENEPKKQKKHSKSESKTGFKVAGSSSWTPVKVSKVPSSVATTIQSWSETNKKTDKKSGVTKQYDLNHEKYGRDIQIKFNKDAAASAMYQLDKGSRTPLSEDERKYLVWDIESAIRGMWEDRATARKQWERMKDNIVDNEEADDKKTKKKGKGNDDIDDEDMMDLEDIGSKKKKKKKKSKK